MDSGERQTVEHNPKDVGITDPDIWLVVDNPAELGVLHEHEHRCVCCANCEYEPGDISSCAGDDVRLVLDVDGHVESCNGYSRIGRVGDNFGPKMVHWMKTQEMRLE